MIAAMTIENRSCIARDRRTHEWRPKLVFTSPGRAWDYIIGLNGKYGPQGDLHPYYCEEHQGWHIGHGPYSQDEAVSA